MSRSPDRLGRYRLVSEGTLWLSLSIKSRTRDNSKCKRWCLVARVVCMRYASACLGVGIVRSTMATTAGPRESPKPGKASQPPYPPSHSPLIGTHSVLFFWPWSSLQTQKQLQHQESSALSQETIYRDGQMCLASSTYC